jgi:hypothetical protein
LHNQSLGPELVNTYRAWDTMNRRPDPANDDLRIIDIGVAPPYRNPLVFNDARQVEAAFDELLGRAPHAGEYGPFMVAKCQASLLHLRMGAGQKATLKYHAETAMGVTPKEIDETIIEECIESLDAQLAEHGLRFDRRFENALNIDEDEAQLKRQLETIGRQTRAFTVQFTGAEDVPAVEPTIVSEDKGWVGKFSTDDKGELYAKLNIHPRHKKTIAGLAAWLIHETQGHGGQFGLWKQQILNGEMDSSMGVTTLHTPEGTQAEFNALTIEQLGLRELGKADTAEAWLYRLQADYNDLFEMVWHNSHIRINSGYTEQAVAEYIADRLPFTDRENIEKSVPEHRKDLRLRGYLACYEPAMAVGRLVLALPEEKQKSILRESFSRPMTLAQIEELVVGKTEKIAA